MRKVEPLLTYALIIRQLSQFSVPYLMQVLQKVLHSCGEVTISLTILMAI